jgi:hypothetical protein
MYVHFESKYMKIGYCIQLCRMNTSRVQTHVNEIDAASQIFVGHLYSAHYIRIFFTGI